MLLQSSIARPPADRCATEGSLSRSRGSSFGDTKQGGSGCRGLRAVAVALALAALCCATAPAIAAETSSPEGAAAQPPAATPPAIPFTGNPEVKARLDAPSPLSISGERLHDDALRRFYTA